MNTGILGIPLRSITSIQNYFFNFKLLYLCSHTITLLILLHLDERVFFISLSLFIFSIVQLKFENL